MRRILVLVLLPLLAAILLMPEKTGGKSGAQFTPEQLREDFRVLKEALEEGHSGLYRYTSKAEMDRTFERAAQSLDRPMDAYEFYRLVAPVIAAIKCGHTRSQLPEALIQEIRERTPLLPLQVKVLDRKAYVWRDLANQDRRLAGMELQSINGVPASEIIAKMLAATPGDGDVTTLKQALIGSWRFAENLVALMGLRSPYDVKLADRKNGREEEVRLVGAELPKLRAAAAAQDPNHEPSRLPTLEFRDGGRIGVMRVAEFAGSLREFFQDSFEEMHAKKTAALIIDLRNNGGGMDDLGKLLFSYFVEAPFDYYADVYTYKLSYDLERYATRADPVLTGMFQRGGDGRYHALGHPNWGIQQPSKPTFRGKVFVLINGGSFSTTTEFLSHMHFRKRATFIGEEAGGGYYGNTAGHMPLIALPNTKVQVMVPLVTYKVAVSGYKETSRGLIPDHPVKYTIEEVLAGKDKEMELALRLARQPKAS